MSDLLLTRDYAGGTSSQNRLAKIPLLEQGSTFGTDRFCILVSKGTYCSHSTKSLTRSSCTSHIKNSLLENHYLNNIIL
jgi:hypothetical protein